MYNITSFLLLSLHVLHIKFLWRSSLLYEKLYLSQYMWSESTTEGEKYVFREPGVVLRSHYYLTLTHLKQLRTETPSGSFTIHAATAHEMSSSTGDCDQLLSSPLDIKIAGRLKYPSEYIHSAFPRKNIFQNPGSGTGSQFPVKLKIVRRHLLQCILNFYPLHNSSHLVPGIPDLNFMIPRSLPLLEPGYMAWWPTIALRSKTLVSCIISRWISCCIQTTCILNWWVLV